MGFDIASLFAGGISGLFSGAASLISRFKADPSATAAEKAHLAELDIAMQQAQLQASVQLIQAQTKIDEIEAASTDKFSSRWRPACGWLGVCGLAYSVVAYPLLVWASLNFAWKTPPPLDVSVLATMLMGMLGLGTMRTYEKVNGVAK